MQDQTAELLHMYYAMELPYQHSLQTNLLAHAGTSDWNMEYGAARTLAKHWTAAHLRDHGRISVNARCRCGMCL